MELGSGYYKAYTVITAYPGTAYFFAGDSSSTTSGGGALYDIFSYSSSGAFGGKSPLTPAITNGDNVAHGAIDHAGALWITSETSDQIARIYLSKSGVTNYFTPIKTPQQPEVPAIDGSGNAWIPIQTTTSEIYEVSSSGGTNILDTGDGTAAGTAEMTSTFGAAVDGNGNIWFTNRCGNYGACGFKQGATTNENGANTVFVLNGTGGGAASNDPGTKNTFISPPTNYFPEAQYPATATSFTSLLYGSLNLAIDPSGNVWITNYTGGSVVELVGAAAPVRTPLSVAAAANELGQKP
jgi:streptogramin lyase